MSAKDDWTPYGLEAIRIGYLRRRRILGLIIALGLASAWLVMMQTTTTTSTEIFVNGKRANSIDIDIPEQEPNGPVRVSLEPGRVTRADSGGQTAQEPIGRTSAPVFETAPPVPYRYYVLVYGPYALLAAALFFLAKRRGKHDEVNYGVYKGAMPLEMISAHQADRVFSTRFARTSLFGKRQQDHLPAGMLRARDEEEGA